jgi:hypothetical protein
MRIDNKPETKEESRTGRYSIRTFWSARPWDTTRLDHFSSHQRIRATPNLVLFAS